MKKGIILIAVSLIYLMSCTQPTNNGLKSKLEEMEDRIALKNLVDTFSILSDVKDAEAQSLLFTEDAVVQTYRGDDLVLELKGRKQIAEVFGNFLHSQEAMYHLNGQQTLTFNGDTAKGVAYCQATYVGMVEGKKMITMNGVYYHDTYLQDENGKWLISDRKSRFEWTDRRELAQ